MSTATQDPKTATHTDQASGQCAESNFHPIHGTIVHVEFTVPDFEQAKAFYGELFGWQFHPFQENECYFQATNAGPGGCLVKGEAVGDGKTVVYVNVDDIAATVKQAEGLGAKLEKPRTEIPGGHGWFAHLRAPEGNLFGVHSRNG